MPRPPPHESTTSALLLRSSPVGEADAVISLFSQDFGRVDAFAPSARRPGKTRRLLLEPLHTLRVTLSERTGRDLPSVTASTVERARTGIVGSLEGLEAAGQLLRWLRDTLPPRHPEPAAWELAVHFLDRLGEAGSPPPDPAVATATFGVRLLWVLGYQLELDQCIRCGKPCPDARAAYLDPAAGGLRCAACGGGPVVASAALRAAVRAAAEGADDALTAVHARELLSWLTVAFESHSGGRRFAKVRGR